MTLNLTDPNILTTTINSITRTKYFPMELHAVGLMASTKYDAYYNGSLVNAFCKPYGGDLGATLISDTTGKLVFMFMMAIPYDRKFLVNNSLNDVTGELSKSSSTLQLVAPNGATCVCYIPLNLKM